MKLKITVWTPKNQAEKSMATNRMALLGIKHTRKVVEEKLVAHNQFYWVLEVKPDDVLDITRKCAKGEITIRKFYSVIFKLIKRANRIAEKSSKAGAWLKRWVIKRLKKMSQGQQENDGLVQQFENMNDDEFNDFIKINDEAEMRAFLEGELIKVEEVEALAD